MYGCTILTLTRYLKTKLDGNYTRMLRKSWREHPSQTSIWTATYLPSHKSWHMCVYIYIYNRRAYACTHCNKEIYSASAIMLVLDSSDIAPTCRRGSTALMLELVPGSVFSGSDPKRKHL